MIILSYVCLFHPHFNFLLSMYKIKSIRRENKQEKPEYDKIRVLNINISACFTSNNDFNDQRKKHKENSEV